ncbi:MAG: radical SAM protein [Sedimentisphaerales bacterium]|nr:radical SAM protein [Sedimentisphaerales bacterium]
MINSQEKKYRLLRAYLGGHPLWCTWQVTYRCDFRCRFCHYWCDDMALRPEQTVGQFEAGSRKLAQWGTLMVSLAGGEPLLRHDIVPIVETIGRWHMPFLTTNGYRVDPELAEDLFEAGLWGVSVSIDYADPERHDHARGVCGAYRRAIQALETFSRARKHPWQRVNLMAVLLDDNLDQIEPLLELAGRYDAYFMIQPYSVLKTGSTLFRHAQTNQVGDYLLDLRRRHANFLSNPRFLARFDAALDGGVPNCAAGKAFFNIDSTGDIAICVEHRARPVANLFEHDMSFIHNQLRTHSRCNPCRQCWYNCRGEIESLYNPYGLLKSLPTWIFDHGRPSKKAQARELFSSPLRKKK